MDPVRQVRGRDVRGLGRTARTRHSAQLEARTGQAGQVVRSICPYCAVGCGQLVYVKGGRVVQIEGDADSPISRGRPCPKGSASEQLVNHPLRERRVDTDLLLVVLDPNVHIQESKVATCDIRPGRRGS